MKLALAFAGSRGDVQPAVALGVELSARGHDVRMAVPPNLTAFVARSGLRTSAFGEDTKALLDSDLVAERLKSRNPVERLRAVSEITVRGGRRMQRELLELAEGADAIVGGSAGQERALNVADALGVCYVPLHYCPVRRNHAVSLLPLDRLPGSVRYLSWVGVEQALWRAVRRSEHVLATDLGLSPPTVPAAERIERRGTPELQAYDPLLFPGLSQEWGARRPLLGFLDLDRRTRALVDGAGDTGELSGWLDAGPPPVYLGFGSMTVADPERLTEIVTAVATELDCRILVAAGWGGFMAGTASDRIRVVSHVDHASVLPRCAAAVHHGGAGSTAAGLRAGIPTVVCWIGADQPMWGRQIRRIGAGTSLKLGTIDSERLSEAIRSVLQPECGAAARRAARELIPATEAIGHAAAAIETAVEDWPSLRRAA